MSRKRYISTDISTDTKVAELSETGLLPVLLFTWAVPHMDDWGRITGDPREFKLLVCPGLDVSSREVDEAINSIVDIGLWKRYTVDGKRCISVAHKENWFKHQSYISKDKRENDGGSTFPPPPQNTEERRETPKNAEEVQETPQNPVSFSLSSSVSSSLSDSKPISSATGYEESILGAYSKVFGGFAIKETVREHIIYFLKEKQKPESFVVELILFVGQESTHPSPEFFRKVGDRWITDGINSREENEADKERKKQAAKVVSHPNRHRQTNNAKPKMPIHKAPPAPPLTPDLIEVKQQMLSGQLELPKASGFGDDEDRPF